MNILRLIVVIALLSVSFTVVARQSPLENLAYRPFDSQNGREVVPANLKIAVAEALMAYSGSITEEHPGSMVLSLAPRSHVANVRMDYDAKGFSITYLSSTNLNYEKSRKGKESIHPNYSVWIKRIADEVVASPQLWLTPEQLAGYKPSVLKTKNGVDPDNQARIRFFGQAVLGLRFYRNSTCFGNGRAEVASETGLGGAFGNKENITLGMPVTLNVVNLKERDGILAKAFYREYAINAGEPLAIHASYAETTGPGFGNSGVSRGCRDFGASFVPENGQDYEVTLDLSQQVCQLSIAKITQVHDEVVLAPVVAEGAGECE